MFRIKIPYSFNLNDKVIVYYSSEDAAKRLSMEKLHLLRARLTVTPLIDVYDGLDRELCRPKAIRVKRIGPRTSEEFLRLFFENQRECGGGDIEQLDYDPQEGIAVIIFEDADSELIRDYITFTYIHILYIYLYIIYIYIYIHIYNIYIMYVYC